MATIDINPIKIIVGKFGQYFRRIAPVNDNLPIIDLREVCAKSEAFANDIEPSELGGDLITDAILSHLSR